MSTTVIVSTFKVKKDRIRQLYSTIKTTEVKGLSEACQKNGGISIFQLVFLIQLLYLPSYVKSM